MTFLWIVLWLVVGYFFTYWFVNYFLDDRKFVDQPNEVGAPTLVMLTLTGPAMGAFMLVVAGLDLLLYRTGPFIKRMYGIK